MTLQTFLYLKRAIMTNYYFYNQQQFYIKQEIVAMEGQ